MHGETEKFEKQKKSFTFTDTNLTGKVKMGLNLIFYYFTDICTSVPLFSDELTM
jgi:hypothetical protein